MAEFNGGWQFGFSYARRNALPYGAETAPSDAATKSPALCLMHSAGAAWSASRPSGRLSLHGSRLLDADDVLTIGLVLRLMRRVLRGSGWDWRHPNFWVALEIPGRT